MRLIILAITVNLLVLVGIALALDANSIDEKLKTELEANNNYFTYQALKNIVSEIEGKGVTLEQLSFANSLQRQILIDTIVEYKNKITPEYEKVAWIPSTRKTYYGKESFDAAVGNDEIRKCHLVTNNLTSLNELKFNPTLQSQVNTETLLWWRIKNFCQFLIKDSHKGTFMDELYKAYIKIYKREHPNVLKKIGHKVNPSN